MINENLSIILKYTGSIVAGFYGIYATLTNFRADKDGKKVLTAKGYIGIALLFLSTMLALSTNAIKDIQDHNAKIETTRVEKQKAEEAREKERKLNESLTAQLRVSTDTSEKLNDQLEMSKGISSDLGNAATSIEQNAHATRNLLSDTDILMHPIKDVRFSFWIRIPVDNAHLKSYRTRLERGLQDVVPRLSFGGGDVDNIRVTAAQNKTPTSLTIAPGSTLLPNNSEPLAQVVLEYASIELNFYKRSVNAKDLARDDWNWKHPPDLTMSISTVSEGSDRDGGHRVEYALPENELLLRAFQIPSDPKYWTSNGEIRGLPDLMRSQMVIRLPSIMVSRNENVNQFLPEVRSKFELKILMLTMSDGREFWLRTEDLTRFVDDRGVPFYIGRISKGKSK